ncbi:GNAT family N-acetyltransferase [Luteolibacter pohnpeiensis]|uniref:GNAT family N-acetyltransferase n=1 Tax=Luteolibacter pohnpeiensis TaxID=454153 RepID=A0A934S406_9BACT|nr:GNAT family N-acetyltransferase [Luteolibacter pohnpeiensis]MBK1882086.1 GNAT family N-acetyltransferase [Luteolibacter pohnpeiensis]
MFYQIREACAEDAESLSHLIAVLGYKLEPADVISRIAAYQNPLSKTFVAILETELVGFLSFHAIPLFHEIPMLGRITAMAVEPVHQRKGIGASLVKAAENFAISIGCTRMEVTSSDRREKDAHVFYEAHDYRPDCRRFLKHLESPV